MEIHSQRFVAAFPWISEVIPTWGGRNRDRYKTRTLPAPSLHHTLHQLYPPCPAGSAHISWSPAPGTCYVAYYCVKAAHGPQMRYKMLHYCLTSFLILGPASLSGLLAYYLFIHNLSRKQMGMISSVLLSCTLDTHAFDWAFTQAIPFPHRMPSPPLPPPESRPPQLSLRQGRYKGRGWEPLKNAFSSFKQILMVLC